MVSLGEQPLVNSFNKVFLGAAGTSTGASDDQFNRVSFLSHFDGANNGVNNAFDDGSASNHTMTASGNVTQGSFNPYGTNWSHEFLPDTGNAAIVAGTGDRSSVNNDATRISVPASASNFAWGNPFTIEFFCFLRKLSTSNAGGFSYDLDNNFMLNQANSNALADNGGPPDSAFSIVERAGNLAIDVHYDPAGDGSQASVTSAAYHASNTTATGDDFAVNTWHHVAMTWDGSNYYGYVDGVRKATINSSTAPHRSDEPIRIGGLRAGNSNEYGNMDGFISNVRIVIGTNLYPNNNFTPPTSQLTAVTNTKLLTCHSNRMLDGSSIGGTVTADPQDTGMNGAALQGKVSNFGPFLTDAIYDPAVNGASLYNGVDADANYVSAADSADWNLGSGNYTVECWAYATALGSFNKLVGQWAYNGSNAANSWTLETVGTDMEAYAITEAGLLLIAQGAAFTINQWHHVALVRNGNNHNIYIDGVAGSTTSNSGTFVDGNGPLEVGSFSQLSGGSWDGYITDVRLVKGTAVYTSNFTPPTAPLTAITNTKLLLNMADGQAIDSTTHNNVTLYGTAKTSTAQKKFGTASLLLDGNSDYAVFPHSLSNDIAGAGNWTVELFFRIADRTVYQQLAGMGTGFQMYCGATDNKMGLAVGTSSTATNAYFVSAEGGTITNDTWHHVATVKNGTSYKLYLDGTAVISGTSASNVVTGTQSWVVGAYKLNGASAAGYTNGYIDEFRVSKFARYTANFTAPSAAFADKGQ